MALAVAAWNPDDWEIFALSLLQARHGALNIHRIPAAHKGDLGLDYYCPSEEVAYQCYCVVEPIDIATRAHRQKAKITTDLGKLVKNGNDIAKLFHGKPVKRWFLLCPLHDSKDVNLHCAHKTTEIRKEKLSHLGLDFEVGVQDMSSFGASATATAFAALNTVAFRVPLPSDAEMKAWQVGSADLLANATQKLKKRAPATQVQDAVSEAVRSFLQGNALIDALRTGAPDLHEKVIGAITARARSLSLAGPMGGPQPNMIVNTELLNLKAEIRRAAPSLSDDNAEQIALGIISEWIMRCPLDFPEDVN